MVSMLATCAPVGEPSNGTPAALQTYTPANVDTQQSKITTKRPGREKQEDTC